MARRVLGLVVAQARAWLEADLPHAIHLAFSCDEEVGGFGALNLLADLREAGIAPAMCIVGEPPSRVPALAYKGVHRWRCQAHGKAANSSLMPSSVNAVEAAARLVATIADLADEVRDHGPQREGFDVPYATAAVCRFDGGVADNIVRGLARVHDEFRDLPGLPPDADADALQARVEQRARALARAMEAVDAASGFRFERFASMPAFIAAPEERTERVAATTSKRPGSISIRASFNEVAGYMPRASRFSLPSKVYLQNHRLEPVAATSR